MPNGAKNNIFEKKNVRQQDSTKSDEERNKNNT